MITTKNEMHLNPTQLYMHIETGSVAVAAEWLVGQRIFDFLDSDFNNLVQVFKNDLGEWQEVK